MARFFFMLQTQSKNVNDDRPSGNVFWLVFDYGIIFWSHLFFKNSKMNLEIKIVVLWLKTRSEATSPEMLACHIRNF